MIRSCCAWAVLMVVVANTGQAAEKSASPRLPSHRLMFNGDCTFLFGDIFVDDPKAKYEAKTLHRFIDLLADNGVDTYLCNPNGQPTWYPSKRTPSVFQGYKRGDRDFTRGNYRAGLPKERLDPALDGDVLFLNRYLDLQEAGIDWVAEISKACRKRGISPWISIRMNDMHGANSWEKSYMNAPLQRDPKYRLSGQQPNAKDGVNRMEQALDYSHKEVRDYFLLIIREAIEDHDYEGLELDWLRCPFCVDPPASPKQIAMMTDWTAEVRKITDAKAKKLGRPCPLGLRVPVRLGQLKEVGLDVKAMADAGIIDFVNVSNFWQTSWDVRYDELRRELGPRVAIYGVIEAAPNWMNAYDPKTEKKGYRLLPISAELLRGNAAGKLVMGADGIEAFNFFCADEVGHNPLWKQGQANYPALRDLQNLDKLRGRPKQYALATAQGAFMFPRFEYAEQLPTVIEPDDKKAFRLSMCAEPSGAGLELVVQVVVEKTDANAQIGLSLNGSWPRYDGAQTDKLVMPTGMYTHHVPEHRAINFTLPSSAIRDGWNEILVLNGSHKKGSASERQMNSVRVVGLDLAVLKKSGG